MQLNIFELTTKQMLEFFHLLFGRSADLLYIRDIMNLYRFHHGTAQLDDGEACGTTDIWTQNIHIV